jgi:hypothetical protein
MAAVASVELQENCLPGNVQRGVEERAPSLREVERIR